MSNAWAITPKGVVPLTPEQWMEVQFQRPADARWRLMLPCGALVEQEDGAFEPCGQPSVAVLDGHQVCPAHESELRAIRADMARETAERAEQCAAILARQQGVAA